MFVSPTATGLGGGAILLWASLASLTALGRPFPPFQTAAIAFAIGESLAVSCLITAVLALACSLGFETWTVPRPTPRRGWRWPG